MADRGGEPQKSTPIEFGEEETLAMIRDVAETVLGPQRRPELPHDAMAPRDYMAARRDRQPEAQSKEAAKTATWFRLCDESLQANRGALAALLWACDALRAFRDRPEFTRLGGPLALALRHFGHGGVIPESAADRRLIVEAYGTKRWSEIQGRRAA